LDFGANSSDGTLAAAGNIRRCPCHAASLTKSYSTVSYS
jgi:hypothetical protein